MIVVSAPFPSSTVMTPSLPTFSKQSARMLPIDASLFAEMEATFTMSARRSTFVGREIFLSSSMIASTALRMPRLTEFASAPAVTTRRP